MAAAREERDPAGIAAAPAAELRSGENDPGENGPGESGPGEIRPGEIRPGEVLLPHDPAALPADAGVVFIGRVRTPWSPQAGCPHSVRTAREESPQSARLEIDERYRAGLAGLGRASHLVVLYWMDRARRDLALQRPRGAPGPRGTFALRSPNRPNPIAMAVAGVRAIDVEAGVIDVEMLDCFDGTPLLDLKPYIPAVDAVPQATLGD